MVHKSKARFRIVIAGRRWGKTTLALFDLMNFMGTHPNSLCFWVVPKYKHLIPVSDAIREWVPKLLIKDEYTLQKTYRYLGFHNGSRCWFQSAEDPDSLRGPGLDYVVLEEAAQLREEVWYSIIRPALADRNGKALIISTPKGKNWLYQEWLRGKKGDPEYEVWQRPSTDRLTEKQVENERQRLPEDIFRQEFLAEFIESGGEVFRNVRGCFKGEPSRAVYNILKYKDGYRMVPKEPIKDRMVYVGVDIARHEEFTVFIALDEDGELVGFERFRQLDFSYQKQRLLAFLEKFPRRMIRFDSRGVGAGFFEELRREGVYVEGIKLTNPLKNEMVHNLVIKLDEGKVRGPYIPELVEELEAFTYHISSSGNVIYQAPPNFNDDCVTALTFAASMLKGRATDWISLTGKGWLASKEGEVYGASSGPIK